jgi:hypothetical protein
MSFLQWRNHPKHWWMNMSIHFTTNWVEYFLVNLGQNYNLWGNEAMGLQDPDDILWLLWFFVEGYDSPVLHLNSNSSGSRIIFHYGEFCSFIVLSLWKGRFHSNSKLWHHHSSLSQLTALRPMCFVFNLWSFQSHCRTSDCVLGCNITRLSDWVTAVLVVSRWAVFITMDISEFFSFYFGRELDLCYLWRKGHRREYTFVVLHVRVWRMCGYCC